jgi:flavin reductase (DIM6/NTAB) family NADH-FMN oxidoreductase RutF
VTVDLRGAMLSTLVVDARTAPCTASATPGARTGAMVLDSPGWLQCPLRTHLPVGDHTFAIGDMLATPRSAHARPAHRRRGAHRAELNRRGTSTSNGRSVATGQPSLITNRCYKEYL